MTAAGEIVIERASHSQIDSIIELRALLLEGSGASYACTGTADQQGWRESYRHWLSEALSCAPECCVLVALHGTHVVGLVTGFIDHRAPGPDCLNGRCGWVQSMVVEPSFRRKGISSQLIHQLMRWFDLNAVAKIALQSTLQAERLYENLGYRRSDESTWVWQSREHGA